MSLDVMVEMLGGPLDGSRTAQHCTAADGGPPYLLSFHQPPSAEEVLQQDLAPEQVLQMREIRYQRQPKPSHDGVWRYRFIPERGKPTT